MNESLRLYSFLQYGNLPRIVADASAIEPRWKPVYSISEIFGTITEQFSNSRDLSLAEIWIRIAKDEYNLATVNGYIPNIQERLQKTGCAC